MNDLSMGPAIADAYRARHGADPSPQAVQAIQAVSRLETYYGHASPFEGSFNMGAVQCCLPGADGSCPDGSFLYKDSRPTAQGQVSYKVCFKSYPDEVAGVRHLVKLLTTDRANVWKVLDSGDAWAIAEAMYKSHYFGGFGKTEKERITGYAKAIDRNAAAIGKATGRGQLVKFSEGGTASGGASSGGGGGFWLLAGMVGVGLFLRSRR